MATAGNNASVATHIPNSLPLLGDDTRTASDLARELCASLDQLYQLADDGLMFDEWEVESMLDRFCKTLAKLETLLYAGGQIEHISGIHPAGQVCFNSTAYACYATAIHAIAERTFQSILSVSESTRGSGGYAEYILGRQPAKLDKNNVFLEWDAVKRWLDRNRADTNCLMIHLDHERRVVERRIQEQATSGHQGPPAEAIQPEQHEADPPPPPVAQVKTWDSEYHELRDRIDIDNRVIRWREITIEAPEMYLRWLRALCTVTIQNKPHPREADLQQLDTELGGKYIRNALSKVRDPRLQQLIERPPANNTTAGFKLNSPIQILAPL